MGRVAVYDTNTDKRKMPLYTPETCLRDRDDCEPLSQIASDDDASFICMGRIDKHARELDQDCYRLCWKNDEVDEMGDWDARDLIDTASVILQGLSVEANRSSGVNGGHLFAEPDVEGAGYIEDTTGHPDGQKSL